MSRSLGQQSDRLTTGLRNRLWTIAQHKYGWGCYGWRDWPSFEALARRGLVECFDSRPDDRRYVLTAAGLAMCARLFPQSPAVLGTYDSPPDGWTPRAGIA